MASGSFPKQPLLLEGARLPRASNAQRTMAARGLGSLTYGAVRSSSSGAPHADRGRQPTESRCRPPAVLSILDAGCGSPSPATLTGR